MFEDIFNNSNTIKNCFRIISFVPKYIFSVLRHRHAVLNVGFYMKNYIYYSGFYSSEEIKMLCELNFSNLLWSEFRCLQMCYIFSLSGH